MATVHNNLSSFDKDSLPDASSMKFAIVVSAWNQEITSQLYKGAYDTLIGQRTKEEHIQTFQVPGSYELPLAAQMVLENYPDTEAVICLGSVIRGETSHFDFVCQAVSQGIKDVSLKFGKPVIFGVLTDDHIQQSRDRSGGKHGNKGDEAAVTAIHMVALQRSMQP